MSTTSSVIDRIAAKPAPQGDDWKALCAALDALSGRALDAALATVQAGAGISGWGMHARRAPEAWAKTLASGGREPRMLAARSVNLTGLRPLKDPMLSTLLDAPELAQLRYITFALCDLKTASAKIVAAAPHLGALEAVNFSLCQLKDTGLSHLSKSTTLGALVDLELNANGLEDRALKIVATSPFFARMQRLNLGGNRIGPEGAAWLRKATLPVLRSLELTGNPLGSAGFAHVLAAPLPALTALHAGRTGAGPGALAALVASPLASRLTELDLNGTPIDLADAQALARWPGTSLRRLTLSDMTKDPEVARAMATSLAKSGVLQHVEHLDLSSNPLDAASVAALLAAAPALQLLRLASCGLGADAAAVLAESPALAQATQVSLSYNALGDAGATALARSKHLGRMTYLELSHNGITEAGRNALATAATLPAAAMQDLRS